MEALANRIKKNYRHLSKWARRQQIECYRIYDQDIPEFPFCVDIYGPYVYAAEYVTTRRKYDEHHPEWLEEIKAAIITALDIHPDNLFLKERKRLNRRSEQYEKTGAQKIFHVVTEGGLKFKVNFTDYLDTGLFLDHRPLRGQVRKEVAGKNFLNLFSYTGAFSVYAAAGGAASVTTVDLSNTYLNWAKENFEINGFRDEEKYVFINSDVMTYLRQVQGEGPLFDLVFVDPPSFSNSKKTADIWDTQKNHAEMLALILRIVRPGGVIYFSNNLRNFVPEFEGLSNVTITDITGDTIPEDFRNRQIHHCYKLIKG